MVFISGLIFMFLFSGQFISAQEKENTQTAKAVAETNDFVPGTFVDDDKDGVCDNYESRVENGYGRNYVDEDKDGVCDNYENNHKHYGHRYHKRNGYGYGYGYGYRHGRGYRHNGWNY